MLKTEFLFQVTGYLFQTTLSLSRRVHAAPFYSALCCFKMMLWKWVEKSPWASHRRIHKASGLLICSLIFYCFCFRKWIPGVLKCADCLMGLVDLCCRKKRVQRTRLRFRFYMSCSSCYNGFLFSQIPLSADSWLLCSYGNFMAKFSCDIPGTWEMSVQCHRID